MIDLTNVRGLIFDCDGTLIDSLGAWEEAERELFEEAGPLSDEDETYMHAAPIEEMCRALHERYGVGESAEAVLAHLDGYLLPFYSEVSEAMPGAVEFVNYVHEQGIPCVVLSSSPRRYLEAGLDHIGILDAFIDVVTTDEAGCSKQDFDIYEKALKILGCNKEEAWGVDDAPYAIRVMKEFGLRTIAPINGARAERVRKLRRHATLVVKTLEELLPEE